MIISYGGDDNTGWYLTRITVSGYPAGLSAFIQKEVEKSMKDMRFHTKQDLDNFASQAISRAFDKAKSDLLEASNAYLKR